MQESSKKEGTWNSIGFHRWGIWGGGFDSEPVCATATQLPFFNPCLTRKGKDAFLVRDSSIKLGPVLRREGNMQQDVDLVLQSMRDRKRRRRVRSVPPPPPNSLRSIRRNFLRKKALGEGKTRGFVEGNGGKSWALDGWGMV
jgi:hypothetical protein